MRQIPHLRIAPGDGQVSSRFCRSVPTAHKAALWQPSIVICLSGPRSDTRGVTEVRDGGFPEAAYFCHGHILGGCRSG